MIAPWKSDVYSETGKALWYDLGSHGEATDGSQSAFMVAFNPLDSGAFAGFFIYYDFGAEWALPQNRSDWKNYSISVDFKERANLPCIVEFQLKNRNDADNGLHLIHYLKPYSQTGWQTVKASLDQFVTPEFSRPFDPAKVSQLIINVQMLQKDAVYLGSFDNIQFDRPEKNPAGGVVKSIYTSTNDFFGLRIVKKAPGEITISWTGPAALESAGNIGGPWEETPGAISPQPINAANALRFYRLRRFP